jgi:DNA-binding transcriptional ArsR family regulator
MRRDVFQAIADPTRRAIILLTECSLVKQEQSGREIYYTVNAGKMKEVEKWLEQFKKIWEKRFNQLDNVLITLKNKK